MQFSRQLGIEVDDGKRGQEDADQIGTAPAQLSRRTVRLKSRLACLFADLLRQLGTHTFPVAAVQNARDRCNGESQILREFHHCHCHCCCFLEE